MKLALRSLLMLAALGSTLASAQHVFDHIIIVVQENRTPDNLFHGLCAPPYGACPSPYNISLTGVTPSGQPFTLAPDPLTDDLNPDHENISFVQMYNNGGIN